MQPFDRTQGMVRVRKHRETCSPLVVHVPMYVFMAMNFMTHMLSLTAALGGATVVSRLIRTGKLRWAWISAGAIGVLRLTIPLEGLVMAILLALWTLTSRALRHRLLATGLIAAGGIATGALRLQGICHPAP